MTKLQFERKIKGLKIQKIHYENELQNKMAKLRELYLDKKTCDLYGCFFDKEIKEYVIFFIDAERGIMKDFGSYKTEDEAFEKLYLNIHRWENEM